MRQDLSSLYRSDNQTSFWVDKFEGNFAYINIHNREGGGYFAVAVKKDGAWKEVYAGQEIPECAIVDQYKIPKSIMDNCMESAGQARYK